MHAPRRPRSGTLLAFAAAFVVASASAFPRVAHAVTPTEATLAQSLFDEGRALMDSGDVARACPKLEESQRLDPGGGTLLNLAVCHEKAGRLATAWLEYAEALSLAKRDRRDDRIPFAEERVRELRARVPRIVVTFRSPASDHVVKVDGAPVPDAALEGGVPVDPGSHRVEAGRRDGTMHAFDVAVDPGAVANVVVPVDTPNPATAPTTTTRNVVRDPRRTAAWVTYGGAAVAVLFGVGFGADAIAKNGESDSLCKNVRCADARAVALADQANGSAWASNVAFGVGLTGAAVATWLLLTSGSHAVPGAPADGTPIPTKATAFVPTSQGFAVRF
ncbi:MAG: hypothetical protein U0169_23200 [Polyangiaceae bacterium]